MKKIVFTLLTFLYLGTSSGFAMHLHYCMGMLIEANFVENTLDDCENCGMERSLTDDNGCCSEESQLLKVDNKKEEDSFTLKVLQSINVALAPNVFEIPQFLQLATIASDYPLVNSPPRTTKTPVYLLNCVFRI